MRQRDQAAHMPAQDPTHDHQPLRQRDRSAHTPATGPTHDHQPLRQRRRVRRLQVATGPIRPLERNQQPHSVTQHPQRQRQTHVGPTRPLHAGQAATTAATEPASRHSGPIRPLRAPQQQQQQQLDANDLQQPQVFDPNGAHQEMLEAFLVQVHPQRASRRQALRGGVQGQHAHLAPQTAHPAAHPAVQLRPPPGHAHQAPPQALSQQPLT